MGMPVHVQADGRVGSACQRPDRTERYLVAQRRAGEGLRHQGHAKTATYQADQGMQLCGLLNHPGVDPGVFSQADQLAVIAAAQGLWSKDKVFVSKIAQLDGP